MSSLKVSERDGSNSAERLRKQGVLPMAIQQRNHTTLLIQSDPEDLRKAVASIDSHGRVEIELPGAGRTLKAIIKQIDKDYRSQKITHVLFQEVTEDDMVKMDIPVIAIGTPTAVTDGQALLLASTDHIKIRGQMGAMPDHIEVDVSGLEIGSHVAAGDVPLPEGFSLLSSPETTLFSVNTIKVASLEPETAAEGEVPASEEPTPAE